MFEARSHVSHLRAEIKDMCYHSQLHIVRFFFSFFSHVVNFIGRDWALSLIYPMPEQNCAFLVAEALRMDLEQRILKLFEMVAPPRAEAQCLVDKRSFVTRRDL